MDFTAYQRAFAAHIRDPRTHPAPADLEDRRMAIYRELFFNNVDGFISNAFPVLHSLYTEADWSALVRSFFARHRAHTPLFLEIPREFLEFLQHEYASADPDPPFLLELAHYEWAELALSVADVDVDLGAVKRDGDLLAGRPVLSPLAWLLRYEFPVHRIGPQFRPTAPPVQPTYLMMYRDLDDEVQFLELNPVTARLIELLSEDDDRTGRQLLEQITRELQHPQPEVVMHGGASTLEDLRERTVVLGTQPER